MVKFFIHSKAVWLDSFIVFFSLRSWEYFWKKTEKERKTIHIPGSVMTLLFIVTFLYALQEQNLPMSNYVEGSWLEMISHHPYAMLS